MPNQETPQRTPSFDWILWLKWILVSTLGWVAGLVLPAEVVIAIGTVMGFMQWIVLRSLMGEAGWWILATAVGWAVGQMVVNIVPLVGTVVVQGAVLGAVTGTMQWFVLRRWVYRAAWWIVMSTLGWAVGPVLGTSLVGAVVGAVTGFALELLLRHARLEL